MALLQKFFVFLCCRRSCKSLLVSREFSLEMLEETSRLRLAPESNTLECYGFSQLPHQTCDSFLPKQFCHTAMSANCFSSFWKDSNLNYSTKSLLWALALLFFPRIFKFPIIPHPVLSTLSRTQENSLSILQS